MSAVALKIMFEAGLSPGQIVAIAAAYEEHYSGGIPVDRAADRRREWDRQRKRAKGSSQKHGRRPEDNSGGIPVENPAEFPVENDEASGKEVSPTPPLRKLQHKPLVSLTTDVPQGTTDTKPTTRGRRLPENWKPAQREIDLAFNLGMSREELDHAEIEFRNYWIALPGAKALKLNWDATFNNRVRDRAAFLANRRPGAGTPDARRANTESRRSAWVEVIAERSSDLRSADDGRGGSADGSAGGGGGLRLAYSG